MKTFIAAFLLYNSTRTPGPERRGYPPRSFCRFALLFFTWFQAFIDIPEKLPVQKQMDDKQRCEDET